MPISAEDMKALQTALGSEHGELVTRIKASQAEDASALDAAKAEAKAAEKAKAKAEKAAEKAAADLETAKTGESEQLATLTKERDAALSELEGERAARKDDRIQQQLVAKLRDADGDQPGISDAKKLEAALKVLGMPEGIDLDDDGQLIGADAALKSFRTDHGYFFGEAGKSSGHGGNPAGKDPKPAPKPAPKSTKAEAVQNWTTTLYPSAAEA